MPSSFFSSSSSSSSCCIPSRASIEGSQGRLWDGHRYPPVCPPAAGCRTVKAVLFSSTAAGGDACENRAPASSLNKLIAKRAHSRDFEGVLACFRSSPEKGWMNKNSTLQVIRACSELDTWGGVCASDLRAVWDFRNSSSSGTASAQKAMTMLGRAKQSRLLFEILDLVEFPSGALISAAINSLCREGRLDEAIHYLRIWGGEYKEYIGVAAYTSVIGACKSGRKWETAMSLFKEMESMGIRPNKFTFNAALGVLTYSGEMTLACKLLCGKMWVGAFSVPRDC
jgi:pentatricopeptide repeat protein